MIRRFDKVTTIAAFDGAGAPLKTALKKTDHLVIASDTHGPLSTVSITGETARTSLGLVGGSRTTGASPFAMTATTSPGSTNTGGLLVSQGTVRQQQSYTRAQDKRQ